MIVVKKLKKYIWEIFKHRSNQFRFFEENMDSQEYTSISKNSVNKIKEILQKLRLQSDNDIKYKSNVLFLYT